jgi:hypothetical protein
VVSGGGRSADDTSRAVDQRLTHGQDAADEEWLRTIGSAGVAAATGVDDMAYRTIQPGVRPFNMPTNLVVSRGGDLFIVDGYGNADSFPPGKPESQHALITSALGWCSDRKSSGLGLPLVPRRHVREDLLQDVTVVLGLGDQRPHLGDV